MLSKVFKGEARVRWLLGGFCSFLLGAGVLGACSTGAETGSQSPENGTRTVSQAIDGEPALPSPRRFASALDLECYKSEGEPPVAELGIRQLNPVLKDVLPNQRIHLGELERTCLPVAKNNVTPPQDVLPFERWTDLTCYRAEADPVDVPVNLKHINPVLQGIPDENVRLKQLKSFCSPVRKNSSQLEPAIRRLVEHLDFACYEFEELTPAANRVLTLTHLNPVVREFGFPNRVIDMKRANQLCVPVAKNQQPVPEDVKHVVEWVDFMVYHTEPQFPVPPFPLWLTQLNPLFADAPPTLTTLTTPNRLMVPVAKNQHLPPID
jgi:hypothetical protein